MYIKRCHNEYNKKTTPKQTKSEREGGINKQTDRQREGRTRILNSQLSSEFIFKFLALLD